MAGTHEENMKDPAWLTTQMERYKDELRKLQEKHDAQLAGVAEDRKTIASLNEALAESKSKAEGYANTIADLQKAVQKANGDLELLRNANGELVAQVNDLSALAKSRRVGLAQVAAVINPLLAAE